MPSSASLVSHEKYVAGVELLLEGKIRESVEVLRELASAGSVDARLPLAKGLLELRDGDGAGEQIRLLLEHPPTDPGMLGYLHLLCAAAHAVSGRGDAVERELSAAQAADPRMEHAVRDLRRRLRKGRPPVIRF